MRRFSTIFLIAMNLVGLSMTVIFAAFGMGFVPDDRAAVMAGRGSLCETVAINCVGLARKNEIRSLEGMLTAVQERNPAILSVGVRRTNGDLIVRIGQHPLQWSEARSSSVADERMQVPINLGRHPWGTIEFCFAPAAPTGWSILWKTPLFQFCLFFAAGASVLFYCYLNRVLYQLNPSRVIPHRVKSAFDALSEGILLLDHNGRIVMSNKAFRDVLQLTDDEMLGRDANQLPGLRKVNSTDAVAVCDVISPAPWQSVLADHRPTRGDLFELDANERRTFFVNCTPILDESQGCRGVIVSFEDVTELQRKQQELIGMLNKMEISMTRIKCQNIALQKMATRSCPSVTDQGTEIFDTGHYVELEQREAQLVSRLRDEIEIEMDAGPQQRVPGPHSSIAASRLRRSDSIPCDS